MANNGYVDASVVRGIPGKQYPVSAVNDVYYGKGIGIGAPAGSTFSGKSAYDNSSVNSSVNALSRGLQSIFDQIGSVSARNSALSQQYAAEANAWSANQAQIARDYNAAEAEKNRQWQEHMSSTAHQREVADLKAAGLNPVLSAMGGNGAAVTSGATASATVPGSAQAKPDESTNASIVSLLASVLQAQTQLRAMDVSARTQEAIADKYTAMDKLIAEMSNATSRANAELSAETSRYGIDVSSWTTMSVAEKQAAVNKYAAELSSAASRYGAYMSWDAATSIARNQLEWQSSHPNNWVQELNALLEGAGTSTSGLSGSFIDRVSGLFNSSGNSSGRHLEPTYRGGRKVGYHWVD